MTTTATWDIATLERETSDGYVFTAHWTASLNDGEYSAGSYGSVGFERPETELIPFEDLTKELVVSWIKEKLGDEQVSSIESGLASQIEYQKAPTSSTGVPW